MGRGREVERGGEREAAKAFGRGGGIVEWVMRKKF